VLELVTGYGILILLFKETMQPFAFFLSALVIDAVAGANARIAFNVISCNNLNQSDCMATTRSWTASSNGETPIQPTGAALCGHSGCGAARRHSGCCQLACHLA